MDMQTEIDRLLNVFTHFGVDLSLHRIQLLLADLGNPHHQVPMIHVAGSNGKGSVCAYLSAVLTHAGYRVGRYTSPHLVNWNERICINEEAIAPILLLQVLKQVIAAICPDRPSPTQFEVVTAAAWLYFAQQQVDIAVVEVGLGGRLDATNVCDRPLVSIITSLSREHWQKLGPTLADIAREKAGILKPGCPALIGSLPPEAAAAVQQRIAQVDCPAVWIAPSRPLDPGWAVYEGAFADSALTYPLALPGIHQLSNSALAIAALLQLRQQGWAISDETIVQGMAKTRWPGRLQWLTWQGRSLLVDGAHNPAGAAVLRHYLDHTDQVVKPVTYVMGLLSTKDHGDIFRELLRPGDRLYLVPVPDHLSADLEALLELAQTVCPAIAACRQYSDVITALTAAVFSQTDRAESTTVLCGSLYLIGHFFTRL